MTTTTAVPNSLAQVQARMAAIDARLGVIPRRSDATGAAQGFDDVLLGLGALDRGTITGSGDAPTAAQVTSAAQRYVGIPYVWGGTDPATGLDCSGFTQHLLRRFGVDLPRVSADQMRTGSPVPDLASARPGDLLGWDTGPRNVGADHVAVYLGDGLMAEAPGAGGAVQIVRVPRAPNMIRRVLPTDAPTHAGPIDAAASGTGPYAALFAAAGKRHGIDPRLLALVAQRESGLDAAAVSPAGAQGLMQLMPATARGLGVGDPFDPAQSVDGAARLLRSNLDTFGTVDKALAAYNAGAANVQRYGGVPPFPETQRYVQWISARYTGDGRWT